MAQCQRLEGREGAAGASTYALTHALILVAPAGAWKSFLKQATHRADAVMVDVDLVLMNRCSDSRWVAWRELGDAC